MQIQTNNLKVKSKSNIVRLQDFHKELEMVKSVIWFPNCNSKMDWQQKGNVVGQGLPLHIQIGRVSKI